MLVGINPLLRGKLLAALDEMGHGDLLVIADANFPAHSLCRRVIDMPGVGAPEAVRAIATVFPIDDGESVSLMAAPAGILPVQEELVRASAMGSRTAPTLERFAFYEEARQAAVIVLTGETRPYGNLLVKKGVVS